MEYFRTSLVHDFSHWNRVKQHETVFLKKESGLTFHIRAHPRHLRFKLWAQFGAQGLNEPFALCHRFGHSRHVVIAFGVIPLRGEPAQVLLQVLH